MDKFHEKVSEKFRKMDANKDGMLTFEEIKVWTLMNNKDISYKEKENIGKRVKEDFNKGDTNGDGFIDEEGKSKF